MSTSEIPPTEEQLKIINHDRSAIVRACPGAGKTKVLVARVRKLLADDGGSDKGRGIAMLSFTRAAISELHARLMKEGLLPSPPFPHFLGTFDSFIWKFIVAPFGVPGVDKSPQLIPDKNSACHIYPKKNTRSLATATEQSKPRGMPLSLFFRKMDERGEVALVINRKAARLAGFDLTDEGLVAAYQDSATARNKQLCEQGWLGYGDARIIAAKRLREGSALSRKLAAALAARFREVLVDESQDCNPEDLQIIQWLREAGITTKVVCDPDQSIYSFRNGITAEDLALLSDSFNEADRLAMTGNFRSSQNICHAAWSLRPPGCQHPPLTAAGIYRDDPSPVYVLAYQGTRVTAAIGEQFQRLLQQRNLDPKQCPVLAVTSDSVANAVGRKNKDLKNNSSSLLRLGKAVMDFHFPNGARDRIEALERFHEVMLEIAGKLPTKKRKTKDAKKSKKTYNNENAADHKQALSIKRRTYHQYLQEENLQPAMWRPQVISHIRALAPRKESTQDNAKAWYEYAKELLDAKAGNELKYDSQLENVLAMPATDWLSARTIHSIKGLEFTAVCVVLTEAKHILDLLSVAPDEDAEDVRKIYVGISRAKSLLMIAAPQSQAARLQRHLESDGVRVEFIDLLQRDEQPSAKPKTELPSRQLKRSAAKKTDTSQNANSVQKRAEKPTLDGGGPFQLALL